MRDKLQARLAELEAEIEIGERRWHEVDLQQARLRETLVRMSGAIQVLRELLEAEQNPAQTGSTPENLPRDGHDHDGRYLDSGRMSERHA